MCAVYYCMYTLLSFLSLFSPFSFSLSYLSPSFLFPSPLSPSSPSFLSLSLPYSVPLTPTEPDPEQQEDTELKMKYIPLNEVQHNVHCTCILHMYIFISKICNYHLRSLHVHIHLCVLMYIWYGIVYCIIYWYVYVYMYHSLCYFTLLYMYM